MSSRICPFCREKIHRLALVCRYCKRDVPKVQKKKNSSMGWISAITATTVILTGTLILASEFLKERRFWIEE